jgi:retron-type reverse transcriptase
MPPRKIDNLFGDIANFRALTDATYRAVRAKRRKPGAAAFMANLETEVLALERTLLDGTYRPGRYTAFQVHDPKPRIVSAAPFRDRVVHHALCDVVGPVFDRGFIDDSYANRAGKGTHAAIARYERFRDRYAYVLRCDIYRYFPAIDHAVLKADLRRRIACEQTLWLLDTIIDASNPQEPVNLHYPGDDLLSPLTRRRGLPIGNLTSQFFANVYLDGLDHYCKEALRAGGYLRYVDDFAVFHDDPAVLADWRQRIAGWLARRRLSLHPRKTVIARSAEPTMFLGLVLLPGGYRRLPDENVQRFRGKLRSFQDRYAAGTADFPDFAPNIRSWCAHAAHADTIRLREAIFHAAVFRPRRRPVRPPAVSSAAVPGTTIQGTCARPNATGTTPATGTTMPASGWPARTLARAGRFKNPPGVFGSVQGRT